ncbi:MAG: SMI1/KNR4 family protein [Lysinibacillus sp.]
MFTGHYFDNYRLDDVTDEAVAFAETKLKVKLPASYITLMQQQNGGELVNKRLDIGDEVVCVDYLNGIGSKSGEGILLASTLRREWGLSNKFVYLYGDGHTWLTLDYRRYKGDNAPVTYIDLERGEKTVIAADFAAFMKLLTFDESLQSSTYEYGRELEYFPREEVEKVMMRCKDTHAYSMSAGMMYYGFTDEDLTWYFTQLDTYIKDFVEQGYEPYDKPNRSISMLDDFMNCTIAMIKKREINMLAYPAGISVLNRLKTFPTKYDDGMMQRKAEKIRRYYERCQ